MGTLVGMSSYNSTLYINLYEEVCRLACIRSREAHIRKVGKSKFGLETDEPIANL